MDLPVNEAVTENADGSYTIFINAGLTYERQHEAFYHAMHHITNSDFEKENTEQVEYYAHCFA